MESAWKWIQRGQPEVGPGEGAQGAETGVEDTGTGSAHFRGRRERLGKVLDTHTCLVGAHLGEAEGHEAAGVADQQAGEVTESSKVP